MKTVLFCLLVSLVSIGGAAQQPTPANTVMVKNISELKTKNHYQNYSFANLSGYSSNNDGGGGQFYFDDTSTAADNIGTIIKPAGVKGAGRWKRVFDREVNILWFGAKRDGVTNASPAINAAMKAAIKLKTSTDFDSSRNSGVGTVYIPGGSYYCASTIEITDVVCIRGEESGIYDAQETRLNFAPNIKGIKISRYANFTKARTARLFNLYLRATGNSTDSNAHGIWTNTRVEINNVTCDNFGGNGFTIETRDSGNANNSLFYNIAGFYNAGNGIKFVGQESNNCTVYASDFSANAMCGVYDSSFLGNHFFGCHVSSTGGRAASGSGKVFTRTAGKIWQCILNRTKNVQPGVTKGWEEHWFANPNIVRGKDTVLIPLYNKDSMYYVTGAYVVATQPAYSTFVSCYSEAGEGASIMNTISVALFGDHGAGFIPTKSSYFRRQDSRVRYQGTALQVDDRDSISTYAGLTDQFGLEIGSSKPGHYAAQMKYFETDRTVKLFGNNSIDYLGMEIIGRGYPNPSKFGLTKVPPGIIAYPYSGYMMTNNNDVSYSRRIITTKGSPPMYGEHAAGEIAWNIASDTSILAWRCISSGTPGTWAAIKTAGKSPETGTFTGNGGNRVIEIIHGMGIDPSWIGAFAGSDDARGAFKLTHDARKIYVTYDAPTPRGTNNITIYWMAK